MELHIIASGSTGNGYVLQNQNEALIIEAGVNFKKVLEATNWKPSKIKACIITHRHGDHAKYANEYIKRGLRTITNANTAETLTASPYVSITTEKTCYKVGNFKIIPLNALHDVPCCAFIISHPDCGTGALITDTADLPYQLPPLDWIAIEANYTDDFIADSVQCGYITLERARRTYQTHMELQTTKSILKNINGLKSITLIHLSNVNADGDAFQREIEEATGVPTYIAKPKNIIQL